MDNSKITPEALQYLKELTAQKKKDDLKAVIKIDFSHILLSSVQKISNKGKPPDKVFYL